ncbi:PREDICTED: fibrinogen C domain-containing protein 1-like isoform X1 [Amphimedon queenslandica]|uniref:Fibrinogen C-terminal domain-containing protein n=1 Tax=Amphimedon queenslandica TaxID=400682 RepID=A0AAN0JIB2_AMPQE|nr:PREDICTED: fibrinogen C domain-containing protein 1-like isoform X1 [Amphimedon queenslandica]|eukprot:XP_019856541.1 PREDICTED: fibrinogen C domain-containing protein 1-like isoform X1 [Amphimedon queenslandica]
MKMMLAGKLMYSLMIIIVIINTINGNCPDDEKELASPAVVIITNTSVNAKPANIDCIDLNLFPIDCKEWKNSGFKRSGVYLIKPDNNGLPFQVYCDMETDGGGWTVFQRRQDGSVDFYKYWTDYENGFGDLTGEVWLGLSKIYRLTKEGSNTLRVDLEDFEGNTAYANYSTFSISNASTDFILKVGDYNSGSAEDSMTGHNGRKFSTRDRDNDGNDCAQTFTGAWWYTRCYFSNLNGQYFNSSTTNRQGIIWVTWRLITLKFTEMKSR